MKPVSIIFLIVSIILVIAGLLTCSFAMLQANRQGVDLYDTKIVNGQSEAQYDYSEDSVNKIQVEVGDCDVHIVCGAEENKVVMNNFSSAGYICEVTNGALIVEDTVNIFNITDIIENGKIRFKGFRYYLRDRKITAGSKSLTVYISDKFDIKIIDVKVSKGDVDVIGYTNNTDYKIDIVKNENISERVLRYGLDIDSVMLVGHGHRGPGGINVNMRADAFEAVIGAIYILYGLDEARRIVKEVLF